MTYRPHGSFGVGPLGMAIYTISVVVGLVFVVIAGVYGRAWVPLGTIVGIFALAAILLFLERKPRLPKK